MKKLLLSVTLLLSAISLFAQEDVGIPILQQDIPEQILYRTGYVVSYNKDARLPNWVAWHLTSNHTTGEQKRPNNIL